MSLLRSCVFFVFFSNLQRFGSTGSRMRSAWLRRIQTERKCMSCLRGLLKTTSVSLPSLMRRFGFIFGSVRDFDVWVFLFFSSAGPDIWLEYAQYSIGGMGSPGGIDKVRSIFERAVTAVGLHMTKGQTLWEAYREFENAVLSTMQVCVSRNILSDQTFPLINNQMQEFNLDYCFYTKLIIIIPSSLSKLK